MGWTIPIRLVRSFEYRVFKLIVLSNVDSKWTTEELVDHLKEEIRNSPDLPAAFKALPFDTLKILHKAHSFKTNNPVINLDHDDWILQPRHTLEECGVENETELSAFIFSAYEAYKANPVHKW